MTDTPPAVSGSVERPSGSVPWSSYLLCGVLGVREHCRLADVSGLQLTVSGTIPPSSGLSSSSALVCAAALATLHANKVSAGYHSVSQIRRTQSVSQSVRSAAQSVSRCQCQCDSGSNCLS